MVSIKDIYTKYKIIPILQTHQLRVAAVASIICDALDNEEGKNDIVLACLLHDMGNILKFDMTQFPESFEPQGIKYWQKVKDEFELKYSTTNEHLATLAIVDQIGESSHVRALIESIGFMNLTEVQPSGNLDQKICNYSDMRVGPKGVLSLDERLADGDSRYRHRIKHTELNNGQSIKAVKKIEQELFFDLSLKPQDITDEIVDPLLEDLQKIEVTPSKL